MPSTDIGVLVTLDEESLKNRAILDYTSRDFTSIRAELVGLAKGMIPEWKTVGETADFGTLLLELFAYVGDALNFYIDRTASEAFLATAVRPQSVLYIADMLGYTPVGQSAASCNIKITAYTPTPDDPLDPIEIPLGLQVHSSSSNADTVVVFETMVPLTLKPGESGVVSAIEGVTVRDRLLGVAFGVPNTQFVLPDKGVIFNSIHVVSAEGYHSITWSYTADLATARPTQAVFTSYIDDKGLTHLVFGDNTSGRIPSIGAKIYATYRYGVGAAGNSVGVGELVTFVPSGAFEPWKITVTNEESPRGGADAESIDSMKYTIPRAGARIRRRAVTLNDYADLALQVAGVSKSMAFGTVYTAVHVRIGPALSTSGDNLSLDAMTRLRNEVAIYMADKVLIGSSVIVEPETSEELWQDVYIRVTVHISEVYNRNNTRKQVEHVLRKMLSYDLVDFGTRVSLGDLYRATLTVSGVLWAEIRWLSTTSPTIDTNPPAAEMMSADTGLPVSPTTVIFQSSWKRQTVTNPLEPASGYYRLDDDTTQTPTEFVEFFFSNFDNTAPALGSNNRTSDLAKLDIGDHIVVQTKGTQASWWDYVIHDMPTYTAGQGAPASPGFARMKAILQRRSAIEYTPPVDSEVFFDFVRFSPTPVSVGEVADIATAETKIPRIEPTEIIEDAAQWEEYAATEEERTHDGLWVIALGGLANT